MPNSAISDLFRMQERFMRSVNIERDFADPKALSGYILTPQTQLYTERLLSGLRNDSGQRAWRITGDYGSGKSSFALLFSHLLAGRKAQLPLHLRQVVDFRRLGISQPLLIPILVTGSLEPLSTALLRAIKRDLTVFAGLRRNSRVFEQIENSLADAEKARLSDSIVTDIIQEACSHIIDSGKGSGLLILLDELGKFLEYGALHPERQDVFLLQTLAEIASRSLKKPIFVVGLLHQGFNAYAEHLSVPAQKEWEKVAARFDELIFNQTLEHTTLLIADALNIRADCLTKSIVDRSRHDMAALVKLGWYGAGGHRSTLAEIAQRLYPLHPSTVPALLRLFTRFGQNERSLFSFLLSNEPFGLQAFADRAIGPDNFYRLYHLYDFARYSFGSRFGKESFRTHWNHIDSMIESFASEHELDLQILKTVGLLNLLDSGTMLATEESLAASIGVDLDKVRISLRRLTHKATLYYRGVAGGFCLWPHTSVNVEKLYQEAVRTIDHSAGRVADGINRYLEIRPIVARRHYINTGSLRHFEVRYCPVAEIDGHLRFEKDSADGLVLVILCETEEERQIAVRAVRSKDIPRNPRVVSVIPQPLNVLRGLLLELQRWQWVQANTPELVNDTFAAEEVSRQLATAADSLERRVKSLLDLQQFGGDARPAFFRSGKDIQLSTGRRLLSYLSKICEEVYPDSPRIANELVNRRTLSSAAAAARMRLLEGIFEGSGKRYLGMDETKKPPEMSLYLSVLKSTHLHRETSKGWTLSIPPENEDCGRIRPAMLRIQAILDQAEGKRVVLSDIFSHLRRPPLGIRDGLIPIVFSVFAVVNEQHLAFYDSGIFMRRMAGLDVMRFVKNPEMFEVQFCRMSGIKASVFERLLRVLELSPTRDGAIDILDIVRPLCVFVAQLPNFTQRTQQLAPHALAVRDVLLAAREPSTLLFVDLPGACGFREFGDGRRSSKEIDKFVAALKEAIDELRGAFPRLRERIKKDLFQSMGLPRAEADFRSALSTRAERLSLSATDPRLRAFCNRLADTHLATPEWLESIGSTICSIPPNRWSDSDCDKFAQELSVMSNKFRHVESIVFAGGLPKVPGQALRLAITESSGAEADRVLFIRNEDEETITEIEERIAFVLEGTAEHGIAAATRALWKLLAGGGNDANRTN